MWEELHDSDNNNTRAKTCRETGFVTRASSSISSPVRGHRHCWEWVGGWPERPPSAGRWLPCAASPGWHMVKCKIERPKEKVRSESIIHLTRMIPKSPTWLIYNCPSALWDPGGQLKVILKSSQLSLDISCHLSRIYINEYIVVWHLSMNLHLFS